MKLNKLLCWTLVSFIIISVQSAGWSQERSDVFNPKTSMVWLGVDFSEARYFGDEKDAVDGEAIKAVFDRINDLIISESDKYNLERTFHNRVISTEIEAVTKVNDATDDTQILSEDKSDYSRMNPPAGRLVCKLEMSFPMPMVSSLK